MTRSAGGTTVLAALPVIALLSACASTPAAPPQTVAPVSAGQPADTGPDLRTADILDVQSEQGKPVGVTVNLGSSSAPLEPGTWGLLQTGRREIGWVKLVEVGPTTSRAEIEGTLSEPIAKDTRVVLRIRSESASDPAPAGP